MSFNEERRFTPGGITLDQRLADMDEKLDKILDLYSGVDKRLALVESKLDLHDKILMGVCGAVGLGFVGALISVVIK